MPLRINSNPAAINTNRNLIENQDRMLKALEKLSSGSKVNRASDGAAALIISEQMRAQISGVKQAIDNSETAVGMVQTSEGALNEISGLLIKIRQLAVHAANEGANDEVMLQADQFEINNALDTIDRMTFNTQFGQKRLLDGSQGANGVANGKGLEYVGASPHTQSSPVEGYNVRVQRLGSRAHVEGSTALTQDLINQGEELTIAEGGRTVSFKATPGDTVSQTIGKLRGEIEKIGLDVDLRVEDGKLMLQHNKYGSEHNFSVASSTPGVLSAEGGKLELATPGQDIQGTIGGYVAFGRGQILTGGEGTPVEGLQVRYQGNVLTDADSSDSAESAGRVAVFQNSLVFQVGGNVGQTVSVSLNSTNTRTMGRGVINKSAFKSLRDVNVLTPQKAQDTQRLVDQAVNEVTRTRAELGAFQKNTLETNLAQLRITAENLISAESTIRDVDFASEIAEFTRDKIMVESSTAMLAQAIQLPRTVLKLLD
ncbi:MAG TPA: flagellin [bacterium]|nr:flagellin [bacterium]